MQIKDGNTGRSVRVDNNSQIHTFSVIETERNASVDAGKGYNINTGLISLSGSGESAVLYIKNDESPINGESDLVIDSIVVGINTRSATITEDPVIKVLRNPTAGTIIDDAVAADMVSNSNFGSSNELSSLVYKASASGKTFTDGDEHGLVIASTSRTAIPELYIDMPKGSSLGVTIDLNTSGSANVYVAVICHRKDGNDS